ncbi:YdcF family protein [Terasakiella pusilla]|uniref:YdcF family protein n=1 Tax=Terasakiella pusilla TaxID=64973 RepID=UPI003AA91900
MFFYLSKILWWFVAPGNILFVLLLAATAALFLKQLKAAKVLCASAVLFYVVVGALPTGVYLKSLLENRFPVPQEMPQNISGIIVLGGAVDVYMTAQRGMLTVNGNAERILSLYDLGKKYQNVPLIFTGGSGLLGHDNLREAQMIKPLLKELVPNPDRLIFEDQSRNTYENGVYTKAMLPRGGTGPWLLVTSARHMPRSVAVFRKQGISVLPYPVDFRTGPDQHFSLFINVGSGMTFFQQALHEWLGLLAYYLTGKTSEFFPSP